MLSAFALIGLLASIQGIMFAYGRNLYSLSRAGYYPAFLSLTGKKKTPYWGLIVGAIIGFAALFIIAYGGSGAGSVVLNIAVWGAVLAYLLQMVSYVLLKKNMPDIKRPFTSRFGVPGAVIAGLLALCIFVAVLLNPDYRLAVYTMVPSTSSPPSSSRSTAASIWCSPRKRSSRHPEAKPNMRPRTERQHLIG